MSKSYNDCLSTRIRCGNSTPSEDALADAAPDLLAALRELMEISRTDEWSEGSGRLDDALADARAALARVAP